MRLTERLNQSCLWGAMIRFVSAHFPQELQKMPADCLLEQNQSISQQESISADTWGSVVSFYIWKCICHCCFTSRMCHHQLDTLWVLLSDFRDKVTIKVCQKESWFSNNVPLSFFFNLPTFFCSACVLSPTCVLAQAGVIFQIFSVTQPYKERKNQDLSCDVAYEPVYLCLCG